MQTQNIVSTITAEVLKPMTKIIDPQKVKIILSKKFQKKVTNPEELLQELNEQISYQIQKTQYQILKQKQREDKIKLVEQRSLKTRAQLKDKIQLKLERSNKKKSQQKNIWLEKIVKARKIKQDFIQEKKQEIYQADLKPRLQRFKQIKAQNNSKEYYSQGKQSKIQRISPLKRSFSQRSSLRDAIQKSKELEQFQYFKKIQMLQKRKIYEKIQPKISLPEKIDKSQQIEKLNYQSQNHFIQKLGTDLWKIQQARVKKETETNSRIEKNKKELEIKSEQRYQRVENLKADTNERLKARKDVLNKKNERFLTKRNKSSLSLMKNLSLFSNFSQQRDTFEGSKNSHLFDSISKMSKTLENFKSSQQLQRIKAEDYLVNQKQKAEKSYALEEIKNVLRAQKVSILIN